MILSLQTDLYLCLFYFSCKSPLNDLDVADEADPTWKIQAISSDSSYHRAITFEKAKEKLRDQRRDGYLTRYSKNRKQFTLTVYKRSNDEDEEMEAEVFTNFNILMTREGDCIKFEISGTEKKLDSLVDMFTFYKYTALNPLVHGIGEECVYPQHLNEQKSESIHGRPGVSFSWDV